MYVFLIRFLCRSNGPSLNSQMFPHAFGTDQSIGIFVPELNYLCYDQGVLWMWSVYDRVLALCTLYIQISCDIFVYNYVGVNLFNISKYKNSRLVFFYFKIWYCTLRRVDALVKSITKTWKIVVISSWKGIFHYFFVEVVGS